MVKEILIYALTLITVTFCFGQTASGTVLSREPLFTDSVYEIKSCKVIYKNKTGLYFATSEITFDSYGRLYKQYLHTDLDTIYAKKINLPNYEDLKNKHDDEIYLITPTDYYLIDLNKKTGHQKHARTRAKQVFVIDKNTKILAPDTFLGKPCKVVQYDNRLRVWLWKNIPLKKLFLETNTTQCAIKIDEKYIIKPDEFKIPKDIIRSARTK